MVSGNTPGESHASLVTIPCIVFFAVTPVFLCVRIWNRFYRSSGMGLDDWTILASFLFYVAQIFYKLTINLTKTSIILLYLRIFVQRWFRICCYTLMGFILAYMVATTGAAIWQCTPIKGAWDKSTHPTCISLIDNWNANAGFSIATDILILVLPMQPLWVSNLALKQKIAILLVFALGGFGTVTSILRSTTLDFSVTSPDITYDIRSTLWTIIEENIGIICACLPMCRLPLAKVLPFDFSTARKRSSYDDTGSESQSWSQISHGPRNRGVNHSIVRHNDDDSEEYILGTLPGRTVGDDAQPSTIRKTIRYKVSFEANDNQET